MRMTHKFVNLSVILSHPTLKIIYSEKATKLCKISTLLLTIVHTVWQYGLWSFQTGGTKLERFLPKNQHTQRKLLNFENWFSGEVSKIGHHLVSKVIDGIKKCQ